VAIRSMPHGWRQLPRAGRHSSASLPGSSRLVSLDLHLADSDGAAL